MPHLMYFAGIVNLMEQALHFTYEDAADVAEPLLWCFQARCPHSSEHSWSRGEKDAEGEPGGTPYQHRLLQGHAFRSLMRSGRRRSPEQASLHAVWRPRQGVVRQQAAVWHGRHLYTCLPGSSWQAPKPIELCCEIRRKVSGTRSEVVRKLFPEVFRSPPPPAPKPFRNAPRKFSGSAQKISGISRRLSET